MTSVRVLTDISLTEAVPRVKVDVAHNVILEGVKVSPSQVEMYRMLDGRYGDVLVRERDVQKSDFHTAEISMSIALIALAQARGREIVVREVDDLIAAAGRLVTLPTLPALMPSMIIPEKFILAPDAGMTPELDSLLTRAFRHEDSSRLETLKNLIVESRLFPEHTLHGKPIRITFPLHLPPVAHVSDAIEDIAIYAQAVFCPISDGNPESVNSLFQCSAECIGSELLKNEAWLLNESTRRQRVIYVASCNYGNGYNVLVASAKLPKSIRKELAQRFAQEDSVRATMTTIENTAAAPDRTSVELNSDPVSYNTPPPSGGDFA